MIKRIFALLAAVLLLCSLAACKKDATLPGGDSAKISPADSGNGGAEERNPNAFFERNGYTEDFTLRFAAGEDFFDTATGEIFCAGTRHRFDFAPELASLYNSLSEHNFSNLPADMTCKALSGNDAPEGAKVYTLTVTDSGVTHTLTTDEEALKLSSTSNLSNLSVIIREFSALLAARAGSAVSQN